MFNVTIDFIKIIENLYTNKRKIHCDYQIRTGDGDGE